MAAPEFNEAACHDRFDAMSDAAFASMLARGKAESLASRFPNQWILAADQVAVLPGPPRRRLDKPEREEVAVEHLLALAGAHASAHHGSGVVAPCTRRMP